MGPIICHHLLNEKSCIETTADTLGHWLQQPFGRQMGVVTRLLARDLVKIQIETWRLFAWALTLSFHGTLQDNTQGVSIEDLPELGEGSFGHAQLPFKPSRSCVCVQYHFVFTRFSSIQVLIDPWVGGAAAVANIAFKAPLLEGVGCLAVSTWTEGWTTGLSRKGLSDCVRVSRKLKRFGRVATCFALKKVDGGTDVDSFFDFFFCYFLFFFFFLWCCWRWWCCCWCSGVLGGGSCSQVQCYELGSPWT